MRSPRTYLAATLFVVFGTIQAQADQIVLSSDRDNTLYEEPNGALSNGAGEHLFAGRTLQGSSADQRRGLIHFRLAGNIPAGSIITRVAMTLNMSKGRGGARDVTLHRLLADWGEGTSDPPGSEGDGAPSTPGDATWIHTFFATNFWAAPGGDFDPTASAVQRVDLVGLYTWESDAMRADVQSWLDAPSSNFGWLVMGAESAAGTAKRFDTRENGTPANRPELVVEYCPPTNAFWQNYGAGWPGTNGIPNFTAAGDPILCQSTALMLDNSSGASATAVILIGFAPASVPTGLGGTMLVSPSFVFSFVLPGGGATLPYDVPCDSGLCNLSLYLQCLQSDPGASQGVSFTPGLELHHGTF